MASFRVSALMMAALTTAVAAKGQSAAVKEDQGAAYLSQVDQDLTIRRIAILPVIDNVEGIYARPIQTQLDSLAKASHRWDFVEAEFNGPLPSLIELEESPNLMKQTLHAVDADAVIAAAATRGPNGLSMRIDLFMKKDGKMLAQEISRDDTHFNLAEVKNHATTLYKKVIEHVPYDGILLSRQQNRVTINLGKSDGISKDQILNVVQIITVNRHPKFNFLVSSEKVVLGKVKVLKVDETLSFGAIIAEKERGAIQKFAKVAGLADVVYPEPTSLQEGSTPADLASRTDANVTFGKEPKEWLPTRPPSFGEVGMKLGFGSYSSSVNTNVGTYEANSGFYPSIGVHGEMWLTPNWTARTDILQGVISTNNPRSGSNPGTLNQAMSRYSLEADYNFLLKEDFFGPKISLGLGLANYQMYVDNSSPVALTSVSYSGPMLSLSGSFPVSDEKKWFVGGKMNLFLLPSLTETPVTSGSSAKNSVTDFSLFVQKKLSENLRAVGALDFSLYITSFSGNGSRVDAMGAPEVGSTLSQRHTVLSGGVNYLF